MAGYVFGMGLRHPHTIEFGVNLGHMSKVMGL